LPLSLLFWLSSRRDLLLFLPLPLILAYAFASQILAYAFASQILAYAFASQILAFALAPEIGLGFSPGNKAQPNPGFSPWD